MEAASSKDDQQNYEEEALWDSLLEYIAAGSVVPVVGRDLLTIPDESGLQRPLYSLLAEELARRLKAPSPAPLDETNALGAVASQYLLNGGKRANIYVYLNKILEQRKALPISDTLYKLASIQPFRLFVTATFDSLLPEAVKQARGAAPGVHSYDPDGPFPPFDTDAAPVVFHLLGKVSPIPNYVVTEEDAFEFMFAMLSKHMTNIVDLLGHKKLLIIGCRFPSWLVRFLLRLARGKRLLQTVDRTDFVVDPSAGENAELIQFLQTFRTQTEIFASTPLAFVDELERRWRTYERSMKGPLPGAMRPCSVFLSYAHEDRAVAEEIAGAIEANGPPVWFDRRELGAGDEWERKITKNIEAAAIFVPLLSRACLHEGPRFFAAEWTCAIKYARRWLGTPFILPLVIDDVEADSDMLPEEFRATQWSYQASGGSLPADFLERIRAAYKNCQLRRRG